MQTKKEIPPINEMISYPLFRLWLYEISGVDILNPDTKYTKKFLFDSWKLFWSIQSDIITAISNKIKEA